jgi:hypothetical protein
MLLTPYVFQVHVATGISRGYFQYIRDTAVSAAVHSPSVSSVCLLIGTIFFWGGVTLSLSFFDIPVIGRVWLLISGKIKEETMLAEFSIAPVWTGSSVGERVAEI